MPRPDTFSIQQTPVASTRLGGQLIEMTQAPWATQIVGTVDDGLDPQRAAVLEILLDPGMLEMGVEGDLHAAGDHPGSEWAAPGDRAPFAGAFVDELEGIGAADIQVIADEGIGESAGLARLGEAERAGDLDLRHGQLPPIPRVSIGEGQR